MSQALNYIMLFYACQSIPFVIRTCSLRHELNLAQHSNLDSCYCICFFWFSCVPWCSVFILCFFLDIYMFQFDIPSLVIAPCHVSPLSSVMNVYAPISEQPPLGRTVDAMSPQERFIYQHFSQAEFVKKFFRFLSQEENKGKDKFHPKVFTLFKVSCRQLYHCLSYLESFAEPIFVWS